MQKSVRMKTFQDILKSFREGSITEREKGGKFEKLMKGYLLSSPIYAKTLKTVWMWGEFPYRSQFGGKDLGIDLVRCHTKMNTGRFSANAILKRLK